MRFPFRALNDVAVSVAAAGPLVRIDVRNAVFGVVLKVVDSDLAVPGKMDSAKASLRVRGRTELTYPISMYPPSPQLEPHEFLTIQHSLSSS